jgi:hypothetical protein
MRLARRYRRWLGEDLRLTRGGRILFTVVLLLGVAGAVADAVSDDQHGDQAGGVLFVLVALILGVVVSLDAAFRGLRAVARRRAKPS